jgi:PTS system cellobiose-specific IIB component
MKKMRDYAEQQGIDLEITAKGMTEYDDFAQDYDVILLGPQISYKQEDIERQSQKPVAVVKPYDYAIGNAENIFKQVDLIFPQK